MNLFNRKPAGQAVSVAALEDLFAVQKLDFSSFLDGAASAAADLVTDGTKLVEGGQAAAETAYQIYLEAAGKATDQILEGEEQVAQAIAAQRILKRLRPTAQDTGSPS